MHTIEIFTVVKGDSGYPKLFIEHYKNTFPNCVINIFNNGATPETLKLFKEHDCNVISWGPYSEKRLQITKNTCWQNSKADWVIVSDIDEIAEVSQKDIEELPEDVNILSFCGYQMLSQNCKPLPLEQLKHGCIDTRYSKYIMFKPKHKRVIYDMGAHSARISGITSKRVFRLFHYNQGYLKHVSNHAIKHYLYKGIEKLI